MARWITIRERNEMREMAIAGHSATTIASAFDVCKETARRHCRGMLVGQTRERARLKAIVAAYEATPYGEKHRVVERFGLASVNALHTSVCRYRQRIRAAAQREQARGARMTSTHLREGGRDRPVPHAIYPDDAARHFIARAGESYRPSNGTEGDVFGNVWCSGCRRQTLPDGNGCLIQLRAWAYDLGDKSYPAEWVYGDDGQPCCTAFHDKHAPRPAYRCRTTDDLFALPTPCLSGQPGGSV